MVVIKNRKRKMLSYRKLNRENKGNYSLLNDSKDIKLFLDNKKLKQKENKYNRSRYLKSNSAKLNIHQPIIRRKPQKI